jgi:hypothetical protein
MRDHHLYIILALLLLVLYCMMNHTEGFITKPAHATISSQIGGPHKGDASHFFQCVLFGKQATWC